MVLKSTALFVAMLLLLASCKNRKDVNVEFQSMLSSCFGDSTSKNKIEEIISNNLIFNHTDTITYNLPAEIGIVCTHDFLINDSLSRCLINEIGTERIDSVYNYSVNSPLKYFIKDSVIVIDILFVASKGIKYGFEKIELRNDSIFLFNKPVERRDFKRTGKGLESIGQFHKFSFKIFFYNLKSFVFVDGS
jgi:hypothetical protein